ncbi:MAG: terminase small subunit [Pseudomonadota bacterium]
MTEQPQILECNQAELASVLNVSVTTIQNYRREGMPVLVEGANGKSFRFDVHACIAWVRKKRDTPDPNEERRINSLRELQKTLLSDSGEDDPFSLTGGVSPADLKKLYEIAHRKRQEDLERGLLTRTAKVEAEMTRMFAYLRSQLLGLPDVLTRNAGLAPEQTEIVHKSIVEMIGVIHEDMQRDEIRGDTR